MDVTVGLLIIYLAVTLFVGLIMLLGVNTSKRKHGFEVSYAEAFVITILWPLLPVFFFLYQLFVTGFDIMIWWQNRKHDKR